jgi:hypothetical protein
MRTPTVLLSFTAFSYGSRDNIPRKVRHRLTAAEEIFDGSSAEKGGDARYYNDPNGMSPHSGKSPSSAKATRRLETSDEIEMKTKVYEQNNALGDLWQEVMDSVMMPRLDLSMSMPPSTPAPSVVTSDPEVDTSFCFNTTTDILVAQLLDPPVKDIRICAGANITIGIPTNAEFSVFEGGDVPLTALHDDVTIQCGENGDPNDECIISGGYIQFATVVNNPFVPDRNITTNNLLLKGLTFTGQLTDLPGLASGSVAFSAPGSGMVMEDCVFDGLTAAVAITNAATLLSGREDYPYFSSDLTVQRCIFNDIIYGASVILNDGQTVKIIDDVFNDIRYADIGTTTYGLVSSVGGITEVSSSSFGASEVVTAAAFWWNLSPTAIASTFEYSNNADLGVTILEGSSGGAVNATDTCPEGLMKVDLLGATIECLVLFS